MARSLPALARAARIIPPALLAVLATTAAAGAHDIRELGDGKFSHSPKRGYLYSCQTQFRPGGPGAPADGPWISSGSYDLAARPSVDGAVNWPNAEVSVTREGDLRIVRANNLPTHPTGIFPIARSDEAYQYDRNPNSIREQNILLRLPADPEVAAEASCVPMGMIGFTLVGGAIYNAIDARGRDAAAYEILDKCGGHPQRNGQYHYHDDAACLPHGHEASGHSELIGYALDGFGVYGPDDVGGRELTNGDLDGCHGHVGPVVWDGEVKEIYHYHMTNQYPSSIGCFRGTPVNVRMGGGDGQPRQDQAGVPPAQQGAGVPRQAPRGGDPLAAVAADLGIDVERLRRAVGAPPPDLERASATLGISLQTLRAAFMRHPPR